MMARPRERVSPSAWRLSNLYCPCWRLQVKVVVATTLPLTSSSSGLHAAIKTSVG